MGNLETVRKLGKISGFIGINIIENSVVFSLIIYLLFRLKIVVKIMSTVLIQMIA